MKLDKNVDADFNLQLQNTETFIKYSKNITIQAKTHLGTVVLGIVEIVSSSKHTLFDKQRRLKHQAWLVIVSATLTQSW